MLGRADGPLRPTSLGRLRGVDLKIEKDRTVRKFCDSVYQPPRPTQPPTFCGTGNEYWPKCGNELWLVKTRWLIRFVDKRVGGR